MDDEDFDQFEEATYTNDEEYQTNRNEELSRPQHTEQPQEETQPAPIHNQYAQQSQSNPPQLNPSSSIENKVELLSQQPNNRINIEISQHPSQFDKGIFADAEEQKQHYNEQGIISIHATDHSTILQDEKQTFQWNFDMNYEGKKQRKSEQQTTTFSLQKQEKTYAERQQTHIGEQQYRSVVIPKGDVNQVQTEQQCKIKSVEKYSLENNSHFNSYQSPEKSEQNGCTPEKQKNEDYVQQQYPSWKQPNKFIQMEQNDSKSSNCNAVGQLKECIKQQGNFQKEEVNQTINHYQSITENMTNSITEKKQTQVSPTYSGENRIQSNSLQLSEAVNEQHVLNQQQKLPTYLKETCQQEVQKADQDEDQFGDFEEEVPEQNDDSENMAVQLQRQNQQNEKAMKQRLKQQELQRLVDGLPDYSFMFVQQFQNFQ